MKVRISNSNKSNKNREKNTFVKPVQQSAHVIGVTIKKFWLSLEHLLILSNENKKYTTCKIFLKFRI